MARWLALGESLVLLALLLAGCDNTGSLQVDLTPVMAVEAGAKWNVDGGEWQNSGAKVPNLAAGEHRVAFKQLHGWTPPPDRNVDIVKGEPKAENGIYTSEEVGEQDASLQKELPWYIPCLILTLVFLVLAWRHLPWRYMKSIDDEVILYIVIGAIVFLLVCLIGFLMHPVITGATIGLGALLAELWRWKKHKEEAGRQQIREEQERQEIENRNRYFHDMGQCAQGLVRYIADTFLADCLILDSNIWMNEEYNSFFLALRQACEATGQSLVLYGPQFDEICNVKKAWDYGEEKNRRARLAITRVEYFQTARLLSVRPITLNARRGVYADPLIVRLLSVAARRGMSTVFISDDKELRIRVREVVPSARVVNLAEFKKYFDVYETALRHGLIANPS